MAKRRKVTRKKRAPLTAAEKRALKQKKHEESGVRAMHKTQEDLEHKLAVKAAEDKEDSVFSAAHVALAKQERDFKLRRADIKRIEVECMQQHRLLDACTKPWQAAQARMARLRLEKLQAEKAALESGDELRQIEVQRAELVALEAEQAKRASRGSSALSAGFTNSNGNKWKEETDLTFSQLRAAMLPSGKIVLMHSTTFCPHCPKTRLRRTVDGDLMCPSCKQQVTAAVTAETNDSAGTNTRAASFYKPREHTMGRMKSIQGQRRCRLSPDMWRKLCKLAWTLRIRKEEANSWVVRAMMAELGITHKYDFANWVRSQIWGETPPQFNDVVTQEISIMVTKVQALWKDYNAILDAERAKRATVTRRRRPRNHVNHSNSAYLLRVLLAMRGYNVDPWVNSIIDRRNMTDKDTVMSMIAQHYNWDMSDVLHKGPQALRDLNDAARKIMRRPRPPPTVNGALVTAHWAASDEFTPCVLVVDVIGGQRYVVVGPLSDAHRDEFVAELSARDGLTLDPSTDFMVAPIPSSGVEPPLVYVKEWQAHAVDLDVVKPVCAHVDAIVTHINARQVVSEAKATMDEAEDLNNVYMAAVVSKMLSAFGDDALVKTAYKHIADGDVDGAVRVLCDARHREGIV